MKQSVAAFLALVTGSAVMAMPFTPAGLLVGRDGQCTSSANCPAGYCCSKYGYCGTGTDYCGSSGGQGSCSSNSQCPSGQCCSQYGYCGTGTDYCGTGGGSGSGGNTGGGGGNTATCTSRKLYQGNGSTGNGWPDASSWVNFDTMWNLNAGTIGISCTQFGQTNNSPTETANLKAAILSVSASSGVDSRFILATVMQESKGCVRVNTSYGSVPNPGLMQDHNGANSCYNVNPCPNDTIVGMIKDGTTGTSSGEGLLQILQRLSTSGSQQVYQAARIYNSGSIPASGNLSEGGATSSYASDIADRLGGCVF
ncbi:Fc.00g034200.m01.CDS01 [Cosmosporella sp. VM-42]